DASHQSGSPAAGVNAIGLSASVLKVLSSMMTDDPGVMASNTMKPRLSVTVDAAPPLGFRLIEPLPFFTSTPFKLVGVTPNPSPPAGGFVFGGNFKAFLRSDFVVPDPISRAPPLLLLLVVPTARA